MLHEKETSNTCVRFIYILLCIGLRFTLPAILYFRVVLTYQQTVWLSDQMMGIWSYTVPSCLKTFFLWSTGKILVICTYVVFLTKSAYILINICLLLAELLHAICRQYGFKSARTSTQSDLSSALLLVIVNLFHGLTDSAALRSDCDDLELHCPQMAYYPVCKEIYV